VPSFRRRESVVDADRGAGDPPQRQPEVSANAAEALSLAEEAEAEAAEAEATAAAARARARAIRLRRQAQTAATEAPATEAPVEAKPSATEVEPTPTATEVASHAVETEASETAAVEAPVASGPAEVAEADEAETETAVAAGEPPESGEDKPAGRRLRSRIRFRRGTVLKTVAATIAIACTAALITLSVLMVINHKHQAAESQRRAEFAAAARQSVVTLMSLDFNKAKDDVQRIIDNSTGQFHDDFKNQADDFIKVAQDSKVITEVTVNATGVEQMADDSATVLVSATSRVSNAAGAKQEPRSWRLSVLLQRDGGQLKMARVEFVP
jgi:Mce-associated membrane protein